MRPPPRPASACSVMKGAFSVMALDSFCSLVGRVRNLGSRPLLLLGDGDRLDHAFGLRTRAIDGQQTVLEVRSEDVHAVGQHEGPRELPRGDAAMQKLAALVLLLPAADDQLLLLNGHFELIAGKAGDRERDAQPLRIVLIARHALDVVGRITVSRLGDAVEHALDLVEADEERTGKRRNAGHGYKALLKRLCRGPYGTPIDRRARFWRRLRSRQIWAPGVKC